MKKVPKPPKLLIALDAEDRTLLEEAAEAQKTTLAEVVRRAIREYAQSLRRLRRKAS